MGTWNAYGNEYWPADYLIDAQGHVRYASFGEGDYSKTETAIRALLAEAGHNVAGHHPTDVIVPSQEATPETYLGTARGQGWATGPVAGIHDYGAGHPGPLEVNEFAFSGTWQTAAQPVTAISNAGIDVEFEAKHVYLVLSSTGTSRGPCRCCWTAGRSPPRTRAPTSTTASSPSRASACTHSSRSPTTNSTASACASRRGHGLCVYLRVPPPSAL